jgi:hypothetical protein
MMRRSGVISFKGIPYAAPHDATAKMQRDAWGERLALVKR